MANKIETIKILDVSGTEYIFRIDKILNIEHLNMEPVMGDRYLLTINDVAKTKLIINQETYDYINCVKAVQSQH